MSRPTKVLAGEPGLLSGDSNKLSNFLTYTSKQIDAVLHPHFICLFSILGLQKADKTNFFSIFYLLFTSSLTQISRLNQPLPLILSVILLCTIQKKQIEPAFSPCSICFIAPPITFVASPCKSPLTSQAHIHKWCTGCYHQ